MLSEELSPALLSTNESAVLAININSQSTISNDNRAAKLPNFHIYLDLKAKTKAQLLVKMANIGESVTGYKKKVIFSALTERERIAPLIGCNGVAVTAVRLIGLKKTHSFFLRLDTPIMDEYDNEIDLVFFMTAPVTASCAGARHLPFLASMTRGLNQQEVYSSLRACATEEAVMEQFLLFL